MRRNKKPFVRGLMAFFMAACAMAACHGPLPPLAVSPVGHGGPPNRRGPTPVGPLWRANALSAPAPHGPCHADAVPSGIRCTLLRPPLDPYAQALAESAEENFAP